MGAGQTSDAKETATLRGVAGLALALAGLITLPLYGAFEGADLFRALTPAIDGIFPRSMNHPALLPDHGWWVAAGRGTPLGQSWAAYQTVSSGGAQGAWRGAAGVWHSGDDLYRETSFSAAIARKVNPLLTAGVNLAYQRVTIKDYAPLDGELTFGLAFKGKVSDQVDFTVWYGNQAFKRELAYGSLTRQLFQAGIVAHPSPRHILAVVLEKTPGFRLSQRIEVATKAARKVDLMVGYRMTPGMPYAGAQVAIKRLLLSTRLVYHPIFGVSSAFGITFK